jgi:molybdopterin synthase sulfur carrier subunit
VDCSASNLSDLLAALDQQFPDLSSHLHDEAGELRRFLNVYVNEEDIRFLGGTSYQFRDGDEVLLVPSIAGGAD